MIFIMEQFRDDYYKSFGDKYENHVNKFIEYLRRIGKLDSPTKIDLSDVKNSVKYYSDIGKINYRASMESHLESIKSFYDFLSENGKTKDIFTQINYENYKNEIFDLCNLEEGIERKIFSMDTIKEIIVKLDLYLDKSAELLVKKRETERYYQRQVLRLYIKLTLIAPAIKSVICNLEFSDFADDYRIVKINKTPIRIPNGLRKDLLVALKLAKESSEKDPQNTDKIFQYIYKGDFKNTSLNSWFCSFLKEYSILEIDKNKDTYELEPIMKSAIKFMVDRMVNPAVISKISGIKIATLETTYYADIDKFQYSETIDEAINWEIAKNDYYNYI